MDHLIHQPAAEATQKIIGDLKQLAPDADAADQIEDILKSAFGDEWELIEENTHLYQVRSKILG